MEAIGIVILFFAILAGLIAGCATCERKGARITFGIVALAWSGLMFLAAHTAESFDLNIWYSGAAAGLLDESVKALEDGRNAEVVATLKQMRNDLQVTYESRGNFKELAEKASSELEQKHVERIAPADDGKPPN